jgi:hypothetical protein
MYVNQCIDWDAWASSHAFYGKRKNTPMSKYATFQLLAALSDSSINTWKYDVVDAKFLQSLENKSSEEILNEIRSRIENSDLWKNKVLATLGNDVDDDFKVKLLNSAINAILKTQYPFTIKGIGKKQ